MYTLYVKPGCPFCAKVLKVVEEHEIPVQIKETTADGVVEELIAHGGKRQVPYLVDSAAGTAMYESDAIISYLQERHTVSTATDEPAEAAPSAGNVCPSWCIKLMTERINLVRIS